MIITYKSFIDVTPEEVRVALLYKTNKTEFYEELDKLRLESANRLIRAIKEGDNFVISNERNFSDVKDEILKDLKLLNKTLYAIKNIMTKEEILYVLNTYGNQVSYRDGFIEYYREVATDEERTRTNLYFQYKYGYTSFCELRDDDRDCAVRNIPFTEVSLQYYLLNPHKFDEKVKQKAIEYKARKFYEFLQKIQ